MKERKRKFDEMSGWDVGLFLIGMLMVAMPMIVVRPRQTARALQKMLAERL